MVTTLLEQTGAGILDLRSMITWPGNTYARAVCFLHDLRRTTSLPIPQYTSSDARSQSSQQHRSLMKRVYVHSGFCDAS